MDAKAQSVAASSRSPRSPTSANRAGSPRPSGLAATRIARSDPGPSRRIAPRSQGPRPVAAKMVGSFIPRLTKPVFERYGFSAAAVITDWATIVGPDIARYTLPERLKWPRRIEWTGEDVADDAKGRPGATLVLAVLSGRALDIQYKSGQLIDRINAYFGYRAVATLRIVQVAELARRSDGVPPTATQIVAAPQLPGPRVELAGIAEPGLKAALERMANGLGRRQKRDLSPA